MRQENEIQAFLCKSIIHSVILSKNTILYRNFNLRINNEPKIKFNYLSHIS